MVSTGVSSTCWEMDLEGLITLSSGDVDLPRQVAIRQQCQASFVGDDMMQEQRIGEDTFIVNTMPQRNELGEVVGCRAVAINISPYKNAQLEIASLQRHTESILKAVGEGIYGINLDGEAVFVNPAAERMTGWSAEETIGQQIHYMHHHSRPDGSEYPHHQCPIYAAISDGEIHHDVDDEVFWRKDGSSFPVEYTSTPVYEDGELVGAVAVFKDITERKRAQADLLAAFREVEHLKNQLQEQNSYLKEEIRQDHNFGHIIGTSQPVQAMLQSIEQVAVTDASVLVLGESGTGKELIAHAIHDHSPRAEQPLVKVNCGAISAGLVESELFGHEKGAFTGAHSRRKGRFELADGGTLFLDELGELPLQTQVKLLRVLQEQEFERVGGTELIKVDVRIVAATNRDLKQQVDEGHFREDLYYRLNVFPIDVPPLRVRGGDISLLARHFLQLASRKFAKANLTIREADLALLAAYPWPGNIRELQNVIERAAILARDMTIDLASLISEQAPTVKPTQTLVTLSELERNHIARVLAHTQGIIAGPKGAAVILAMHPNTLRSRMAKLGLY